MLIIFFQSLQRTAVLTWVLFVKSVGQQHIMKLLVEIILTDAIFETVASGVPSKSQKSFICGEVGQTINLKSPGKGAPPQPPPGGYSDYPYFGCST